MYPKLDHSKLRRSMRSTNFYTTLGKIEQIVGMTVEASGMSCNIGDVCSISTKGKERKKILSEVVGFRNNKVLLMPYGDIDGIGYGSFVINTGEKLKVKMSEDLIGRTKSSALTLLIFTVCLRAAGHFLTLISASLSIRLPLK